MVRTHYSGFLGLTYQADILRGYEIHMGATKFGAAVKHPFMITSRSEEAVENYEGVIYSDGLVMGAYIHRIFDNDDYRRALINALRIRKGLEPVCGITDRLIQKEVSYNRLANIVRSNFKWKYFISLWI